MAGRGAAAAATAAAAAAAGGRLGGESPASPPAAPPASAVALVPVVRPDGVMLDWRASMRALRRAFFSVLLIGRLLQQLPRMRPPPAAAAAAAAAAAVSRESEQQQQQQLQVEEEGAAPGRSALVDLSSWSSLSRFFFFSAHKEDDAGVRRALARKQNQLREWESPGTHWQDCLFVNSRGQTLFTQSWTPSHADRIKGLVLLLHGLNEHSGRYGRFARELNLRSYAVVGMDWIGHGGSDGLHGYVESLDHAVSDTEELLGKLYQDNPGTPIFLFGHSTGGAIVLKVALQSKLVNDLAGIVLTSPALRVQPSHPVVAVVAPFFSALLPRYQFRGANRRGLPVTRDPVEQIAKYTDPLVYTGPIRVRTGTEILRITAYLQRNLAKVRAPFLVLHGTGDKVTDPDASRSLFQLAASSRKQLKLYDGLLHDLLFEVERDAVTADIIQWLDASVAELEEL